MFTAWVGVKKEMSGKDSSKQGSLKEGVSFKTKAENA